MFWQIFIFELRFRFTSKAMWICWAILLVKSFPDVLGAEWELMMPSRLPLNSPFGIYYALMFGAFWGQLLAVGFMAQPLLRDISTNAAPLVFSKPVTSRGYLLGKYAASLAGLIFVMSGPAAGFALLPFVTSIFGITTSVPLMATPWAHLAHAFLIWTVVAAFAYGTMHFALAALTGKAAPSYALAILIFMVFLFFTINFEGQEFDKPLMQIIDPLGKSTLEAQIFYWSAEERTRDFISLTGNLLLNRLLYVGIGIFALGLMTWRFDLRKLLDKARSRATRKTRKHASVELVTEGLSAAQIPASETLVASNACSRVMSFGEQLAFAVRSGWNEFARLFSLNPFRIVLVIFAVMTPFYALDIWAAKPEGILLPVALYQMKLVGTALFMLIILATLFFVGEILGREQTSRIKSLIDATPIKTWTLYAGKLFAVLFLVVFLTLFTPVSAVVVQLLRGFIETNPMILFNATLFVMLPNMLAFALLGVIFYAVLNDKMLAQVLSFLTAFTFIILHETKAVHHRLLLYGLPAESTWTDFDANGASLARYADGALYWLACAGFLLVVGYWLWARGTETRFALRLGEAVRRVQFVSVAFAAACLAVFAFTGWQMFHNINILNDYQTTAQELSEKADYERKYSSLMNLAQPKITNAKLNVDLYPSERRADYSTELQLQNRTTETISDLHLELAENVALRSLVFNNQTLEFSTKDDEHRHYIFKLPRALAPNQTATLQVAMSVRYEGFTNEGINGTLHAGGSVFTAELLPRFGYNREREITKESERRTYNLPTRRPLPTLAEVAANPNRLARNLAANDDADYVTYEAVITTDANQIVAAPGRLVSDTANGNRRTFTYTGESAALWDLHFTSARYAVTKGVWQNETQTIPVEIYHLPTHAYNTQRFIESAQFALTQLTGDFGNYPHESIRIAEVPNEIIEPVTSGNLIILPEKKGWLHDYRDFDASTNPDFVQFITAREIARGWWGQIAAPADAQGYPLLVDAMPAYAALTVIEAKHGASAALNQIANLTDSYLRESAIEDGREPSLLEAEDQEYINDKGAIALYSTATQLGTGQLNRALKNYLDALRSRTAPPFTRADEFVHALTGGNTDQSNIAFLNQTFQTVTTYDYKLKQAVALVQNGNRFKLQLDIEARKFQANAGDNRVETGMREPLEVAIYTAGNNEPRIVKTPAISTGSNRVELQLEDKPARVQLDPRRLLVDRNQMDNTATVRMQ